MIPKGYKFFCITRWSVFCRLHNLLPVPRRPPLTPITFLITFYPFTFAAFSAKNIPVVVAVIIKSIVNRVFNIFFPIKTTHLCIGLSHHYILKHITSFWWFNRLLLFFIGLFFICSLRSVICKKYKNAYGYRKATIPTP